jgi:transcriptional regulator with XRE-family HTH domain
MGVKKILMNYGFLKEKITIKCGTQEEFAKRLGISKQSLSNKLNNKTAFTHEEIFKSMNILELNNVDLECCFFMPR